VLSQTIGNSLSKDNGIAQLFSHVLKLFFFLRQ
jgi:hypothetical protein